MRNVAKALVAGAALFVFAVPASAYDARTTFQNPSTTRIETRPFYGAAVTVEAGVRVFRPLPPEQHVIINPGGQTPLSINQYDGVPAYAYPPRRY